MPIVTLQEAQSRLPELIHDLIPGDVLVIVENNQPVARLARSSRRPDGRARRGAPGKIRMAPDFDAPLEEFKEYME